MNNILYIENIFETAISSENNEAKKNFTTIPLTGFT
jgi:hypothetical protein